VSQSILGSFEIGRRALYAHQQALNTIGHNLANAATPGYTRQRAELVPTNPQEGVEVSQIIRVHDRFLDALLLDETGNAGLADTRRDIATRVEALFADPTGTGLDAALDQLFQRFQDLSVHPTDQAARQAALDAGQRVADSFHRLTQRLDGITADLTTDIRLQVDDVNRLLGQVAELNAAIQRAGGQPAPNDLIDQRDKLVGDLATHLGVAASVRDDGSVQVTPIGSGVLIVDGTTVRAVTATFDPLTDTVNLAAGGVGFVPRSGRLAALVSERNDATGIVKQAGSDLDALAQAVIEGLNRVHASGAGLAEPASVTGLDTVTSSAAPLDAAGLAFPPGSGSVRILTHDASGAVVSDLTVTITAGVTTLDDVRAAIDADPGLAATISGGQLTITAGAGTTLAFGADTAGLLAGLGINGFFTGADARSIAVDPAVAADPRRLAAARVDAAGLVHPGDGANALALAQVRTALVASGGTDTVGGAYAALVARVGGRAQQATLDSDRQGASLEQTRNVQAQVSGVSTDEELISLTQSQHAYAAAARYITVIDEVVQTILAMAT
jgi:flagellar hook-associated protein 1 FlgK